MKVLVVVDMQNDFVDGTLGSDAAKAIVPNVVKKIKDFRVNFNYKEDDIIATMDSHYSMEGLTISSFNELATVEEKAIPAHCVIGTNGHEIHPDVLATLLHGPFRVTNKNTFCATTLSSDMEGTIIAAEEIQIVGLCTDICVISNALYFRGLNPNARIIVDASCCAGTSTENHEAALRIMKACCIEVVGEHSEE